MSRTIPNPEGAPDAPRVRLVPCRSPLPLSAVAALERELKFVVPASRAAFVGGWLRSVCAPDAAYPPARVVTVYFDTPDLRLLDEKVNSDYLKSKVRVRWYESARGGPAGRAVFVEAKARVGSTRQKVRRTAGVDAVVVREWPLEGREWRGLLEPLRLDGVDLPHDLDPVLRISYLRERLVDRHGEGRVTLDSNLRVDAVNPHRLRAGLTGTMPGAVVEYKGRRTELPPHLQLLARAGGRRASFSKYLAAYLHVTQAAI